MSDLILPLSFLNLVAEFRPVFTAPSYENFRVLISGFVHAIRGHCITDALRPAGTTERKHFSVYHRFFSRVAWSFDESGLCLLGLVIRAFGIAEVELVLDDTPARRSAKKVALATMHANPVNRGRSGRPFTVYCQVFVVLSVHARLPLVSRTGWALLFMFRVYQGSKRGPRADSPSDRGRTLTRRLSGK